MNNAPTSWFPSISKAWPGSSTEQTRAGNGEYERARRWMTEEANAVIRGALAAGATAIKVNDSHGGFRNLLPDQLHRRRAWCWASRACWA
jgi:D-aminopeptidase